MVVGIDVHKRAHVAALLDERGGELGTLSFANSPQGMRRLCAWLVEHDAGGKHPGRVTGPHRSHGTAERWITCGCRNFALRKTVIQPD
jgi:hypothetical protein